MLYSAKNHIKPTDKVGNLMVYLCQNVDNLFITKLLKLLYIIDEESVKDSGVPVTDLLYKVWEKGPVATNIYNDISFDDFSVYSIFVERIKVKEPNFSGIKVISKNKFDDSEFSDYEIELIDRVIGEYGNYNSTQLIRKLHEKGSLWHEIVENKNLQESFDRGDKTSNYSINLRELIEDSPAKKGLYDEVLFMNNI